MDSSQFLVLTLSLTTYRTIGLANQPIIRLQSVLLLVLTTIIHACLPIHRLRAMPPELRGSCHFWGIHAESADQSHLSLQPRRWPPCIPPAWASSHETQKTFIQAVTQGRPRHPAGTTETGGRRKERGRETATMTGCHLGGGTTAGGQTTVTEREADIESGSGAGKRTGTGTEVKIDDGARQSMETIGALRRLVQERRACIPTACHATDRTSAGVGMGAEGVTTWRGTQRFPCFWGGSVSSCPFSS